MRLFTRWGGLTAAAESIINRRLTTTTTKRVPLETHRIEMHTHLNRQQRRSRVSELGVKTSRHFGRYYMLFCINVMDTARHWILPGARWHTSSTL